MSNRAAPQYATVNGIRIAYETIGDGFPLLMLHGFPRTHRTWERLIAHFDGRFKTVAPDRRGYGDSDRAEDPSTYDNATMASDALGLLDHLGIEEFMVVGHDKGAPAARRVALDNPDRARGLIVIDGMAEGADVPRPRDTTGRTWYFDFFRQRNVAEQLIGQNQRLFFSLFLDRNPHLTAEEHEYYVQMFCRRGSVDAILADYRAGLEIDPGHWKAVAESGVKMKAPVCALWGSRGPAANAPVIESWRQVAEDVRGEAIDDAAHYVHEEQPALVAARILAFADELGVPTA
jgi:haloacetate dehalogenase